MKNLMQSTEIIFWDVITPLLVRSTFLQKTIRTLYPVVTEMDWNKAGRTFFFTAISGFTAGWVIFYALYLLK